MAAKSKEHLAQVKHQLADKYARLSKVASSKVKIRKFYRESLKYRRQATSLENEIKSEAAG